MGSWRKDQSKGSRRYVWGETRGINDPTCRDFARRAKTHAGLAGLQFEKIGEEIHVWREIRDEAGKPYWISCLRFVDDGWGYWKVFYRLDENRWRATTIQEQPLGQALENAARWYRDKLAGFTPL